MTKGAKVRILRGPLAGKTGNLLELRNTLWGWLAVVQVSGERAWLRFEMIEFVEDEE